jgi:outer membrane murein-binding lipoprotein Lpp
LCLSLRSIFTQKRSPQYVPVSLAFGQRNKGDNKMKYGTLAFVLAAIMVAGCATTQKSYQTTTTVTPEGQQQYTVGMTIQATGEDGKQDILSTPKITVAAGKKGQINVGDEKEENGVFCSVLVEEKENRLEALTTILVKEGGRTVLNTSQKTLMNR